MPFVKLALIGFGNVGQALARLLLRKEVEIKNRYDITFQVNGIATARHGIALSEAGIDLNQALELVRTGRSFKELSAVHIEDMEQFIRQCKADVLFENSPVNYESGQPALHHIRTALEVGMHAITANKGPVVHGYFELTELAKRQNKKFYFESTVMDGAPIFSLYRETLPAARLLRLRGILNSTTNLILTRMEAGETFDEAVRYAQSIGIAETDPSGDVDGWDAAIKLAALASVLMETPLKPQDVERDGIRGIDSQAIASARKEGMRWKLVCSAERVGNTVRACVRPEKVTADSPLYNVSGTSSVVQFETDVLGKLTIFEEDPSPDTTAYGLLADFLRAVTSAG
ncbi:MAG: homoserine dehydrogenase [Chloroflexota bacterium]